MHIPKAIIRLAKERALSSFSALAEQTVVDADLATTRAMSEANSKQLQEHNAVRAFLRGDGATLRTRMNRHFASLLERAMLTMHAHKPAAGDDIDYASLTLIDDDVVVRQIEIERLAGRLREAEMVALGRVNLTIAILHDDHDARERENPFRPYVLARALHEALREVIWDEAQSRQLYAVLGQAMVARLPGFYGGIVDVFEQAGVTARLTARPAAMSRTERERLEWQRAAQHLASSINVAGDSMLAPPQAGGGQPAVPASMLAKLPKLQRLQELARTMPGVPAVSQDLLEVVWAIFHKPRDTRTPALVPRPPVRGDLDRTLSSLQQEIAGGTMPPGALALRERLGENALDPEQKRLVDVVGLLFESMAHDELLAAPLQHQLTRLHLPFLRAVLFDPGVLHQPRHPARRLLDRLGSVGAAIGPAHRSHAGMVAEVESIVGTLLDLFDDDIGVFTDAERAFDDHVSVILSHGEAAVATGIAAVAEAEADSARLAGATASLSAILQPLQIDPRLADFILGTWARVLSHPGGEAQQAVQMLPELLWSAQEKTTPEDRAALMQLLPQLVMKVRKGMASIALPEAPSKAAFDRLVSVHMDVLGNKQERARRLMSLQQYRDHFAGFTINDAPPANSADHWVGRFELEAALLRRAATPRVHDRAATRLPLASDAEWLSWARPGTGFEIRTEGRYHGALLCAASAREGAFVFNADPQGCVIYLRAPLLEAMEHGTLRPLESAPLFDRAVESLMAGAECLSGL